MTHDEALKILHTYQKWRRGANIPMPEPKEIGEAIDVAIRALRELRRFKERESYRRPPAESGNNSRQGCIGRKS